MRPAACRGWSLQGRVGSALDPTIVATLVSPTDYGPVGRLSERERTVLELMARGLTNTGIVTRFVVSERTNEAHIRHILTKLDIPKAKTSRRFVTSTRRPIGECAQSNQ